MDNTTTEQIPPRSRRQKILSFLWKAILFCLLLPVVQVIILKWIDPPMTTMMLWQSMEHLFRGERITWSHTNADMDDVAPSFYKACIAAEDQRFFEHNGFDWKAIEDAQRAHKRRPNKPMRGASTITQQVAKNLFLPPVRSFIRKGIEAYYTVLIEFFWSKERILEMYGNIAQLGPNAYGVVEGARLHFKKSPAKLSVHESALLAATLINPARWSASKPTGYISRRASRIARQMRGFPTSEDEDGDED